MPMPHQTFAQVIRRRLAGKEGQARLHELQLILAELPNYKNGPYADLRKWVNNEVDRTRVRKKVVHRDTITVRREGAAQVALVGPPNAGKSSLLQALSSVQIKTGVYAFTTTRPVPATTRIKGVLVQFVEIPGLIEGASEDRGGGRALLSVLRAADAIVFCHPVDEPLDTLDLVRSEVTAAAIDLPAMVAATKCDEAAHTTVDTMRERTGSTWSPCQYSTMRHSSSSDQRFGRSPDWSASCLDSARTCPAIRSRFGRP